MQMPAPPRENEPSTQVLHSVAPWVFAGYEYFPKTQASHTELLPVAIEYVPIVHSVQSTSEMLEHALHPEIRLYLPAEHMMHGPPVEKNTRNTRYTQLFKPGPHPHPNLASIIMQQPDETNPVIVLSPLQNLAAAFENADGDITELAFAKKQLAEILAEGIASRTRARYDETLGLIRFYREWVERLSGPPN